MSLVQSCCVTTNLVNVSEGKAILRFFFGLEINYENVYLVKENK